MNKNDFDIRPESHGRYTVTYTSPKTKKRWCASVTDMELIDKVKTSPNKKSLNYLKWLCKNH